MTEPLRHGKPADTDYFDPVRLALKPQPMLRGWRRYYLTKWFLQRLELHEHELHGACDEFTRDTMTCRELTSPLVPMDRTR